MQEFTPDLALLYSKESLLFQLENVESALSKHAIDSHEYFYIWRHRNELLTRLEVTP